MRLSPIALAAALALAGAAASAEQSLAPEAPPTASIEASAESAAPAAAEPSAETATESIAETAVETIVETAAEMPAAMAAENSAAMAGENSADTSAGMPAEAPAGSAATPLGPVGYDDQGRPGRIHVVVRGDTLWDVSDAYLGTPWVWPSIWKDNQAIANPHLIHPGDRIWITPTEMRKVTAEEADALLANAPPAPTQPAEESLPASFSDALAAPIGPRTYRYSEIQTAGFVTQERFEGAATLLDSAVPRVWLGDPDEVMIGYGAGEASVGDQFEVFRPMERVFDPDTGKLMGWATQVLGWLEVIEVHDETATARIAMSRSEIRRGDHVLPRPKLSAEIPVAAKPQVSGRIIHTPNWRTQMASTDVVYLDRGAADGLEVGSPLEVYRTLGTAFDALRGDDRQLPDEVVAKLIVVQASPEAAVAVVTHTRQELTRGDHFRGSDSIGP